ncbi:MAG: hypothetical protein ABSF63_06625 [Candidatus Bathyarchaeia archaeon]
MNRFRFGLTPFEDLREPVKIRLWILIQQFDEKGVVMATFRAEQVVSFGWRAMTDLTQGLNQSGPIVPSRF